MSLAQEGEGETPGEQLVVTQAQIQRGMKVFPHAIPGLVEHFTIDQEKEQAHQQTHTQYEASSGRGTSLWYCTKNAVDTELSAILGLKL